MVVLCWITLTEYCIVRYIYSWASFVSTKYAYTIGAEVILPIICLFWGKCKHFVLNNWRTVLAQTFDCLNARHFQRPFCFPFWIAFIRVLSLFSCAKISAKELAELGIEVNLVYVLMLTYDFRYVGNIPVFWLSLCFRLRELLVFCVVLLHSLPFDLLPGFPFNKELCSLCNAPVRNPAAIGQEKLLLEAQLVRDSIRFHTRFIKKKSLLIIHGFVQYLTNMNFPLVCTWPEKYFFWVSELNFYCLLLWF